MSSQQYAVLLVYSINHAIRGERLLSNADIPCKLIPIPRHLASDCGGCIRVARADRERARQILVANALQVSGVYDI